MNYYKRPSPPNKTTNALSILLVQNDEKLLGKHCEGPLLGVS